jgi:hypothetical protein
MNILIIDTPNDATAKLPALKTIGIKSVFGYLSSINPNGPKCWTPARVKAAAAAGLRIGLVHEGWGGAPGHGGISAADGARDGAYCRKRAAELGAPKGACVYFACDNDFVGAQIANLVIPYFKAIRAAFGDGFYRVGVYGSGAVCAAVSGAGLADLTWEAQSRGWTGYAGWESKAAIVQGPCTKLEGLDVDSDVAHGDIGDFDLDPAPAAASSDARERADAANPPAQDQAKNAPQPPQPETPAPAGNPLERFLADIFPHK